MGIVTWAFTNLESIKRYLGISVDTYDELLESLIDSASSFLENETHRKLKARNYLDTRSADRPYTRYDGDGTNKCILKEYPVNSVSELTISGATISAADDDDYYGSTGYAIYNLKGYLYYEAGFDLGIQNVRASFNAGYAVGSPEAKDLRELTNYLIAWVYNRRKQLGFKSERIGNYQYTLAEFKNDDYVLRSIARFSRRWPS